MYVTLRLKRTQLTGVHHTFPKNTDSLVTHQTKNKTQKYNIHFYITIPASCTLHYTSSIT